MLVFWDKKLVLFSTPKTGTTALEGALSPHADIVIRNPPPLRHAPVYRYDRFLNPLLHEAGGAEDMTTLAAVRHPIEWLSSWYRYRHRDSLIGHPNSTRDISFDQFVTAYMDDGPPDYANVGAQTRFLHDADGKIGVDFLFQYERLPDMVNWLEQRLDVTIDLKQRNVSPVMPTPLDDGIYDLFREKFAAEFDLWEAATGSVSD